MSDRCGGTTSVLGVTGDIETFLQQAPNLRLLTGPSTNLRTHSALTLKGPHGFQGPVRLVDRLVARNPPAKLAERSQSIEGFTLPLTTLLSGTQGRRSRFCVSYEGVGETQPTLCLTYETQPALRLTSWRK